jgi:tetratricopeptide (TPR) repeat protein
MVLGSLNKWNEAAAVMNKAVTVQNNYAEGHYLLGYCLEKMGNTDEALDSYETAIRYDPTFEEAREAMQRLQNMKPQ